MTNKKSSGKMKKISESILDSNPNYVTVEEFTQRYANALGGYLAGSFPNGETHVVDLMVSASCFAEASFYLFDNFF